MTVRASHPESLSAFFDRKKVFLTGHTGFKGSWLSLWLQRLGAEVTGYALEPPTEPSLFEIARVGEGMISILGDVRNLVALQDALSAAQPDIVFHLAAQALVREGYRNPVETYATNVMGTLHLLEAVRQMPSVRAAVIVTSDKCYDNREWVWGYREGEPLGGRDPYSSSKGCAELVTAAYRASFFGVSGTDPQASATAIASARAGNVIGGGDWAQDRLVPDLLRAIQCGEPLVIRSPQATRPWQHVLEPLGGYLQLAQRLCTDGAAYAEPWNFGPGDEDARSVQWVVDCLTATWQACGGQGVHWQLDPAFHPHEAHDLKLDCTKARARLDWRPRWPLTESIRRIVVWHQALQDGADMRAWSLAEIADYEQAGTHWGDGAQEAAIRPVTPAD